MVFSRKTRCFGTDPIQFWRLFQMLQQRDKFELRFQGRFGAGLKARKRFVNILRLEWLKDGLALGLIGATNMRRMAESLRRGIRRTAEAEGEAV